MNFRKRQLEMPPNPDDFEEFNPDGPEGDADLKPEDPEDDDADFKPEDPKSESDSDPEAEPSEDSESDHKSDPESDSDFEDSGKKKKPAKASAFSLMMGNRNKQFASPKTPKTPKTPKSQTKRRTTKSFGGEANSKVDPATLPVLVKPQDMFDDLCLNYKPFGEFCQKLGRPLRVATMCSGTESPMLALAMMSKAVEAQTGCKLEIEHAFSCEIEPFKQGGNSILLNSIKIIWDPLRVISWAILDPF